MNPGRAHSDLIRPAGPTDPEVSLLSVQSRDGRPIALLANYSLHYVGGVPSGMLSGDYFGVFLASGSTSPCGVEYMYRESETLT